MSNMLLKVGTYQQSIHLLARQKLLQKRRRMKKSILFEKESEDDDYSIIARMQTISIRIENRDKLFKKHRAKVNQNIEEGKNDEKVSSLNFPQHQKDKQIYSQAYQLIYRKPQMYQFSSLVHKLKSSDMLQKLEGAVGLRILLSAKIAPIKRAIEQGAVEQFINLAQKTDCPELQLESIWALANISSGTPQECGYLIDRNCISIMGRILRECETPVMQQCIWFIGNIACDFVAYRNQILDEGIMVTLAQIFKKSEDETITQYNAWAISNLCRGSPLPPYEQVGVGVEALCRILSEGRISKEQEFVDCCWAISYHSVDEKSLINLLIETNLDTKIIQILKQNKQIKTITPCLRIIGNLLMQKDESIVQRMLDYEIIDVLQTFLYHSKKSIRKQVCGQLSYIAGSKTQHAMILLMRKPILSRLKEMFERESEEVNIEIALIFCNMSDFAQIDTLDQEVIEMGLIPHFAKLLNSKQSHAVISILIALRKLSELSSNKKKKRQQDQHNAFALQLLKLGVISVIQKLQDHQISKVYECAFALLNAGCYQTTKEERQFNEKEKSKKTKKTKKKETKDPKQQ